MTISGDEWFETATPPMYGPLLRPKCWTAGHEWMHDERIEAYTVEAFMPNEYCHRCERCGKVEWTESLKSNADE